MRAGARAVLAQPAQRRAAASGAMPPRAWVGQPNQAWRERIAEEESRGSAARDHGYGARNARGALGRYQMTGIALEAAGWRNSHGVWTPQPGFLSVTGDAAFLANPAAQEAALNRYMNDNERQLERAGVWARGERREIIQGFDGQPVPLTPAGLAAAAHREGAPRVIQYLEVRAANGALPASRPGQRGYRSSYNEIERRLRAFSGESYERMR